jgi:axial budding pattern protein 2
MSILLLLLLAHINTLVLAASSISVLIPLDSQLPPIARINNPYSWTFSENTFLSETNASLIYSASSLLSWLSFDPDTRTLSGTPTLDDEGTPRIEVVSTDPVTSDSASSFVSICVTPYPAPDLAIPVSSQFRTGNPSLSSVFLLSNHSALKMTDRPTLRIPSSWSFSIGFESDTFTNTDDIRYTVLPVDGSPLPSWMVFHAEGITLGGVAPPLRVLPTPYSLSLALHALDKNGFSAARVVFDVVIASQEVHALFGSLPTVNITSLSSLDVSFNSSIDFAGVLVDNTPIDLQDVDSVMIDVSQYSWLQYDADTRRLTGQLPGDFTTRNATVLPVVLTTTLNQTLNTQVKLAVVPSYFSKDTLPPILAAPGRDVHFDLTPFFSNATQEDVDLTASYDPKDASSYLHFDTASAILSGSIPSSGVDYSHITVSFTAYSHLTHSTSHTSLPISLTPTDYGHTQPTAGSWFRKSRKHLALGLGIALGLLGGLLALGLLLAALRRWARPPDSALAGVAATRAMTESERHWYGMENAAQTEDDDDSAEKGHSVRANGQWAELGFGLSRTITRASSSDERTLASPGQLSKAEFLGRLRASVRNVSSRYRRARKEAIGRPVLVLEAGDPRVLSIPATPSIPALEGYEPAGYSGTTSSHRGSPSSSTGGHSIPQRRADFAPPRVPVPVAAPGARHSVDSDMSLASDSSMRSHAAEAVLQRATRARSVRSARSTGGQSQADNDGARARIVPFTASRVPAPRDGAAGAGTSFLPARASSLSASVVRVVVPPRRHVGGSSSATEVDELHVGLRYVRALGEDAREASGSFSSLESSHPARSSVGSGGAGGRGEVLRVLVRVGERFRFRLPVRAGVSGGGLTARRVSGELLPAFLYADLDVARGDKHQNTVKFWGVPRADDVGEVYVGVYAGDGACVAQAVIEVLMRSG